jgi:hypothetical protein
VTPCAVTLLAPCWPVGRALAAGLGFAWGAVPTIGVVGVADDPRQALLRDAVAFWNQTLSELRLGFRLGPVARQEGSVPDDLILALSESTLKPRSTGFAHFGHMPSRILWVSRAGKSGFVLASETDPNLSWP